MGYYPFASEISAIYKLYSPDTGATAVLNDPLDYNYAGMLTEVSGLDSPDIRESSEDLVEGDGGVHGRFYYGRRPITLNGRVYGHNTIRERTQKLDLLRRATQALRSDGLLSWKPAKRRENLVGDPRVTSASHWLGGGGGFTVNHNGGGLAPNNIYSSGYTQWVSGSSNYVRYIPQTYTMADGTTNDPYQIPSGGAQDVYVRAQASFKLDNAPVATAPTGRVGFAVFDWQNNLLGYYFLATTDNIKTLSTANWYTSTVAVKVSDITASYPSAYRITPVARLTPSVSGTYYWRFTGVAMDYGYTAEVPAYIDGSSGLGTSAYWWGDPNASPSGDYIPMQINFRRQQPFRESGAWVKDFQIQIVSADPYILSPWLRSETINLGDFKQIQNQGNAAYYPKVDVWGAMNYASVINGSGNALSIGNNAFAAPEFFATDQIGTIDMLKHTFKTPLGSSYEHQILWSSVTDWPKVAPGGGMWTLENGPSGSNLGGYLVVKSRDAWV